MTNPHIFWRNPFQLRKSLPDRPIHNQFSSESYILANYLYYKAPSIIYKITFPFPYT